MNTEAKRYWNGKGVNGFYIEESLNIKPNELFDMVLSGCIPHDEHGDVLMHEVAYSIRNTEILLSIMRRKIDSVLYGDSKEYYKETTTYYDEKGFFIKVENGMRKSHAQQAHDYAKEYHKLYRKECIDWCRDKVYDTSIVDYSMRDEMNCVINEAKNSLDFMSPVEYREHVKKFKEIASSLNICEAAKIGKALCHIEHLTEEESRNFLSWLHYIGFLTDADIELMPISMFSHDFKRYTEVAPSAVNFYISQRLMEIIGEHGDEFKSLHSYCPQVQFQTENHDTDSVHSEAILHGPLSTPEIMQSCTEESNTPLELPTHEEALELAGRWYAKDMNNRALHVGLLLLEGSKTHREIYERAWGKRADSVKAHVRSVQNQRNNFIEIARIKGYDVAKLVTR